MVKAQLVLVGVVAASFVLVALTIACHRAARSGGPGRCARVSLEWGLVAGLVMVVGYALIDDLLDRLWADHAIRILGVTVYRTDVPKDLVIQQARVVLSRVFVVYLAAHLAITGWFFRHAVAERIRRYFSEVTDPVNLAVFRIVVFAATLHLFEFDSFVWYATLPRDLIVAPFGMETLLPHLPLDTTTAWAIGRLFQAACVAALVGLASRTSAMVAVVTGVYVLGLPQFYGKVDHYHHLLWFAAILAVSRCGDVWSVDAVVRAVRQAERETPRRPEPSRAYAVPLRFAWLLLGMIYFFPGLWKVWNAGFEWVFSENLRMIMHLKWSEFPGWAPVFPIDEYPLLYQAGAAATIVFELSFVWLLFFPRVRRALVVAGLGFHNGSAVFLRIPFVHVQLMYVSLLDWAGMLRWAGARLFPERLDLYYDGGCRLCRRTVAVLAACDVFERTTYVNALDAETAGTRPPGVAPGAMLIDMHAVIGGRHWRGFDAYRVLAWRLPLLWPVLPLLDLPPVAAIGTRVYRHVADSRRCLLTAAPATQAAPRRPPSLRPVVVVGGILLAVNAVHGVAGLDHAWPFACYPKFEVLRALRPAEAKLIEIGVRTETGEFVTLDASVLEGRMYAARFRSLVRSLLATEREDVRATRVQSLWRVWAEHATAVPPGTVEVYDVTVPVDRQRGFGPPTRRQLVHRFDVAGERGARSIRGADQP
jgi:predicted DCC family thiol-disulfide oxidoreductase YuxK